MENIEDIQAISLKRPWFSIKIASAPFAPSTPRLDDPVDFAVLIKGALQNQEMAG